MSLKIQRLSWAGIKLELPSGTIFIDPWVNVSIWGSAWTQPVIPVECKTTARNVLISHVHNDHFDSVALKNLISERGNLICHEPIASLVASRGFRTRPVKLYEPLMVGDFTVTAVPAVDGLNEDQVSWVVTTEGKRIFHGGDTLWHGAWWKIGQQYGPFDWAFLPINGVQLPIVKPASEMPAALTPEQAVAAGIVLGAKTTVPIHYGISATEAYFEVPNAVAIFEKTAQQRNLPVKIVQPGEWVIE